ncbi:MAG: oxygen-dependent coproporphyrinogen oxidase [Bacteroidetes bacterium]|nr:oxygen-dependent coproporphyrinogen oxidase [Bacteroidota bacterium]
MNKDWIADEMRKMQLQIVKELELLDGQEKFNEDPYTREEGGGGVTMTLANGEVLEKGGVAFSKVFGPVTEVMKKQMNLNGKAFFATGVSIVLHPYNPFLPIIHMNVRYFEMDNGEFWFGGGIDLTPHYIDPKRAGVFHRQLKEICDEFHPDFYNKFKKGADDYFFLPHRNETRGVGGIFYDHQNDTTILPKEKWFEFAKRLALSFPKIYAQQVQMGINDTYSEQNLAWRNLRRGRYVEFNLVHDRGTKFGLVSGGRTESILLSMPPQANWTYQYTTELNSLESKTLASLSKDIDWVSM